VRIVALAMLLAALPGSATSQKKSLKEQLLGTWILVSHEAIRPDSSGAPVYGLNPNGIAFFDAGGHFIITAMRSDRAKYAIANPTQGTPHENQATAQGTITNFGTYTVGEGERRIAIHIEASFFPNWNGSDQIRTFAIA